jgi:hypothetical protein
MLIYNMESQAVVSYNGAPVFTEIRRPPFDTFAICALTKTRKGDRPGGGGFCGISQCDGQDMSDAWYPPIHFRRQMRSITFAILSEGQYAEGTITLLREV